MTAQRRDRMQFRKHLDAFSCGDFQIHNTSANSVAEWWKGRKVGLGQSSENEGCSVPLACFEGTALVGIHHRAWALPGPIDNASS